MKAIIPKWIIAYLWFVTIMTILFTMIGYFMPDIYTPTGHNLSESTDTLNMYLTRNVAIIVLYLFALFYERIIGFKAVFVLHGVINVLELFNDTYAGNFLELPFILILLIIDIYALVTLYKLKKNKRI